MGNPIDLAVSPIFSVKNRSVTSAKIGRRWAIVGSAIAVSLTGDSLQAPFLHIALRSVGFTSKDSQQLLQIGRERSTTFEPLLRGWVHKSQYPGMQRLPTEPRQLVCQQRALQFFLGSAIGGIAQQRMPDSSHVDADLMSSASARPELH